MATEEARIPLLKAQESLGEDLDELKDEFDVNYHLQQSTSNRGPYTGLGQTENSTLVMLGEGEEGESGGSRPIRRAGSEMGAIARSRKKQQYSGSEMIVAIFVVAFDTKKGNVVEWKYPAEVVLEGIEFKSMASGLHTITKDFIYFKQNQLYGLSCFEKIPVASEEERGARMKSVGLLAVGYSDLHLHMDFLQRQVRSQVESPGDYGSLEEYFRHYRNPQISRDMLHVESTPAFPTSEPEQHAIAQLLQHPVGCFTHFLQFFGPAVFILWRLALLKRRVLLFSAPPIGKVCHRVYCTSLLCSHSLPLDNLDTECQPQFYVNVADIDQMQSLDSFVACTTEKIFQSKTRLYDVFVDGNEFHSSSETLRPLMRPTEHDQTRYHHLNNIRSNDVTANTAGKNKDDVVFAEYFQELNSQIFHVLLDATQSEDHVLTVEMMEGIQLDPSRDRLFVTELAKVYDLNLTVQRPRDMFTCCV